MERSRAIYFCGHPSKVKVKMDSLRLFSTVTALRRLYIECLITDLNYTWYSDSRLLNGLFQGHWANMNAEGMCIDLVAPLF